LTILVKAIVVGGGTAALSAAIRLSLGGVETLQIFRRGAVTNRGESLSPSARFILADLGLWARFEEDGHIPCFINKSVWGTDEPRIYDFLRDPAGHAWHVDRSLFESRLAERAAEVGVRRIVAPRRVSFARKQRGWLASVGSQEVAEADYLVEASGRAAYVARRFGAKQIICDNQVALVATLVATPNGEPEQNTLVEAVEKGWWYSAPTPGAHLAVAFFTDPDVVRHSQFTSPAGWAQLISDAPHTSRRVAAGGYRLESPPKFVAAGSARLDRFVGDGWLAAGDAAMTLDPISAHGMTFALASGRDVADAILALERDGRAALDRYSERLESAHADYRAIRQAIYMSERRWPAAEYWRRRHERDEAGLS
jgi:flavin-dependent dehydrogenase